MNKKLFERIQSLFFYELSKKTGWGKNDVMELYKDCVNKVLLEFIDEL